MVDEGSRLRQRIREIMPDLEIKRFERNHEGLINDVVIVNNRFVFRFAKTDAYAKFLDVEAKILDLIRPHIGIAVPTPIFRDKNSMVYPIIGGQSLQRETLLRLDKSAQFSIAEQLGKFLNALHTTDISGSSGDLPATLAPVSRDQWLEIRQRVKAKVYPLLLEHQIRWAEGLFEIALGNDLFFEYQPTLIHGDLAAYHILCDPQKGVINGVIDFGVAGIGDPALDLGNLITTYGESFVAKMQRSYPALEKHLPRARFYAQSIELQWVLLGIETGEHFWFSAHLGGARDIQV